MCGTGLARAAGLASLGLLTTWTTYLTTGPNGLIWFLVGAAIHAPAAIPTDARKLLPLRVPKAREIVAELMSVLPFLPVIGIWVVTGAVQATTATGLGLIFGCMAFLSLALLHLAAKLMVPGMRGWSHEVLHVADAEVSGLAWYGVRGIDRFRGLLMLVSVILLVGFATQRANDAQVLAGLGLASVAAIVASAALIWGILQQVRRLRADVVDHDNRLVTAQLHETPIDLYFYLCEAQQGRALAEQKALASKLDAEGFAIGIVMRQEDIKPSLADTAVKQFWLAPVISCLDAFVQPDIRVTIHTENHPLSVQFTPMRTMRHVLVVSGDLARTRALPRTVVAFDAIVAPDARRARQWQESLPDDMGRRIVLVGDHSAVASVRTYPTYAALLQDLTEARA